MSGVDRTLERALRERDELRGERDELARRLNAALTELALLKSSLGGAAPASEPSLMAHELGDRFALLPDDSAPALEPSLSRIVVSTRPPADSSTDDAMPAAACEISERPSSAERRRRGRLGCEFEVEFLDDTHLIAGLTQDISEGGVFVATYQKLALGTKVTLALELPGGRVEACGEVRWARAELEGSDQRPGLGVAFTELSPEALKALRQFCLWHPAHYYEM